MNKDCVFCKISHHKKKEKIIYEDSDLVVFTDANPRASHHYLIVSKQHFHDFSEMMHKKPNLVLSVGKVVELVVETVGIRGNWYTWGFHVGGNQTVNHLHAQLISGMGKDQMVL